MKTDLFSIVAAKKPFEALTKQHYRNFSTALRLADLKKLIDEKSDFYLSQEKDLILQYASKDDKGDPKINPNGQIIFDNIDNAQKYLKDISELKATEVDIGKQITIYIPSDVKDDQDTLSPDEIVALGNLVKFVVEDGKKEDSSVVEAEVAESKDNN